VKKLILDKKVEPSDLFSNSGSPALLRGASSVTFSPALSVAAREKEATRERDAAAAAVTRPSESPIPAGRGQRAPNRFTAHSTQHLLESNSQASATITAAKSAEPQEGEYWVKPDLETLKHAGYEELLSFKGLVVGRTGYGEIQFLEPVDLTGLPKLGALLGEIVRFDDKECSVYPDVDEVDKPPSGTGLNVHSRIILVRCWAQDKATREPIKDEKDPLAIRHLKKLKVMKDTHFEDWDMEEGKWTFTVKHF
jgi:nuclear pore complex protein Nup98-Nup96